MPPKPTSPTINTGHAIAPTVAYYMMHEGAGTTTVDLVDGTTVATFTGSPTWITGPTGAAINFNGTTAYLAIPSVGRYELGTGPRTLAMGLRVPSSTSGTQILLGWYNGTTPFQGSGMGLNITTTGHPQYWEGAGWQEATNATPPTGAINDNTWHHIAVTHTGAAGNSNWYVDGQFVNNATGASAVAAYTGVRAIAANSAGGNLAGLDIEWVGVWSTVLSQTDLASIFSDPYQFVNAGAAAGAAGGAFNQTIIRTRWRR